MRRAKALVLLALPSLGVLAGIGCSLGLDPSLIAKAQNGADGSIGPGKDGAAPGNDSGGPTDGGLGDHVTTFPDGGCATDNDCKVSGNVCITSATCDPNEHVCVLGVCGVPDGACQAAVCEISGTCSIPVTVGFHSTSFTVSGGASGCGSDLASCFAVVWPFAFVGTSSGLTVYDISDPSNDMPPTVALTGLSFVPARVISVDRRVYFIGSESGSGATVRLPVAWVDVPGIPALTSLTASSGLTTSSPTNLGGVFPTTSSGLFLVDTSTSFASTEIVAAPVSDTTSLMSFTSAGIPAGEGVVAATGTRLVTYGWDGTSAFASFDFIDQAGTANAQADSVQQVSAMGQTYPQNTFAQGPDGSVLWMTAAASVPDGGPDTITSARMAWLLAGTSSTTFTATQKVDVETYPSPLNWGTPVAGPLAWLDTNTALVLAADQDDTTQTSVQVASRAGASPSILAARHVISANISRTAAVGSNSYGYVLAADLQQATDATLHIFAPSCN